MVKRFVRGGFAHTNYLVLMNGKRYIARFSIIHKHGFKLESLRAYKRPRLRSETFRKRLKPEIFLENAMEAFAKCKNSALCQRTRSLESRILNEPP